MKTQSSWWPRFIERVRFLFAIPDPDRKKSLNREQKEYYGIDRKGEL
ncbi:hypothetical protein HUU42_04155 [bacterium]|nr:hypothetical protein [bacterium]